MAIKNKIFLDYSHFIEKNIDVVEEFLEFQISVSFEFCLDEEFIELWWADLMFQSSHTTNCFIISTVQWWSSPVSWDYSGRVRRIWWILLGWRLFQSGNLICDCCDHFFELFYELSHFFIRVLLFGSHILLVGLTCGLHYDELFIRIALHIVDPFWDFESWEMNISITEIDKWLLFGAVWRRWELRSE